MSADSVGQIGLDLVVNQKDFEKQMGGIQKIAAKVAKTLVAAFAVNKLVSFGAACIELGSDLEEVQNVVDVTFPAMQAQINKFAQDAAASFGLSETMAKQFAGTFGSMAKAFGFAEKDAYDMATALTGLAGDVASFYNITQNEAYTKLKSVFTGETESLKDLGVVMTQTALDSYALANGFGKTTAQMTEAEKVALRYKFVQEQLALASGDFIRTSDGWANQVRVLKLQFDSLKATIGQGLINVLTPVIKVINTLVGKLMTLANAFKSFTEMITGKKGSNDATAQMQSTAQAANQAASATEAVGNAAVESAKKMNGLFAFDKMNVANSDSESSGETQNSAGGYLSDSFDMGTIDTTALDEVDSKYQRLIDKAKELGEVFRQGFKAGLGTDFDKSLVRQQGYLEKIKNSVKGIFTNSQVVDAAKKWADNSVRSLGQIAGAAISMGMSLSENLLGGINSYLSKNADFIKERLVGFIDARAEMKALGGNFVQAFADMMQAFRSDAAKSCTESIIAVFANVGITVKELGAKLGRDILSAIIQPFINNKQELRETLECLIQVVSDVLGTLKDVVTDLCEKAVAVYEEHIHPMFENIANGISDLLALFLDTYNTYLAPVLEYLGEKISGVLNNHFKPCMEKALEMIGSLADAIGNVWKGFIQPLFEFLIATIIPVLAPIIKTIGDIVANVAGAIIDIIGWIFEKASGLLEFISKVFSGGWKEAWEGVTKVIQVAVDVIKVAVNGILLGVETMANGLVCAVNTMIRALNKISFTTPDWLPGGLGGKEFGFNLSEVPRVSIPRLALGGYVKANTPQLAMIGDNRHQGEIVAPEDKIYQVSSQAMIDVMKQFTSTLVATGNRQNEIKIVIKVTGEMAPFVRMLKTELDKEKTRTGVSFEVVYE